MASTARAPSIQAAELHGSGILEGNNHEKESTVVPPRHTLTSESTFSLDQQLCKVFPQLQQSQLMHITRHKETFFDLTGASLHCGLDIRAGRDVLIYDIPLAPGGTDMSQAEFTAIKEQLCCYISLGSPPVQLDTAASYGPQVNELVEGAALRSTDGNGGKDGNTGTNSGLEQDCTDEFSCIRVKQPLTYVKSNDGINITIKLFPKIYSRLFIRILQANINLREKKLVVIVESFQGLFLTSLMNKIKLNSQKTRRLHESLVYKYCCNLLDALLYVSQHKVELRSLDPRCIVIDTQQCILRIFPSAFITTVTRVEEMIYRHPMEVCVALITGLGLSMGDFLQYKVHIGQALAYWLNKYNEFRNLEKNMRVTGAVTDHRQRECRDSQNISQENINEIFYHIQTENYDDLEDCASQLSASVVSHVGCENTGDASQFSTIHNPIGSATLATSPSANHIVSRGSVDIISAVDASSNKLGTSSHGASVPSFLINEKTCTGSTSTSCLNANAKVQQVASGPPHICDSSVNCPCVLYLFLKRLFALSTVYMPLFLKHLASIIKDQMESDSFQFLRFNAQTAHDARLFKLLMDFVGFPIENVCFQENEKTEYAYIVSPHCSKCCRVLRKMVARFKMNNDNAGSNAQGTIRKTCSIRQPAEEQLIDILSKQVSKGKLSSKKTGLDIVNSCNLKATKTSQPQISGSNALINAKSPIECDNDPIITLISGNQTDLHQISTSERNFQPNNEFDVQSLHYESEKGILDLCISSANISQEISESVETDLVQGPGDENDEFHLADFHVLRSKILRHIYAFGLVILCISTGEDPWTPETYILDGLLDNRLPLVLGNVQNKELYDLIVKCIDGYSTFGSIEAILEHEYFKEHLEALQHHQRDSLSYKEQPTQPPTQEKGPAAVKMNANPFKVAHGQANDATHSSVFSSAMLNQEPTHVYSTRSSVGVASTVDSAIHTDGSTTDCPSEQDAHEPRSPMLVSIGSTNIPNGEPLVSGIKLAVNSAYATTPNSKGSSTSISTRELTGMEESLTPLSQQPSENKLTTTTTKIFPEYKKTELLTLRDDTATLAIVYLMEESVEKKVTLSITSEDELLNICAEMLKKLNAENLTLQRAETLENDIKEVLRTQFYRADS